MFQSLYSVDFLHNLPTNPDQCFLAWLGSCLYKYRVIHSWYFFSLISCYQLVSDIGQKFRISVVRQSSEFVSDCITDEIDRKVESFVELIFIKSLESATEDPVGSKVSENKFLST